MRFYGLGFYQVVDIKVWNNLDRIPVFKESYIFIFYRGISVYEYSEEPVVRRAHGGGFPIEDEGELVGKFSRQPENSGEEREHMITKTSDRFATLKAMTGATTQGQKAKRRKECGCGWQ